MKKQAILLNRITYTTIIVFILIFTIPPTGGMSFKKTLPFDNCLISQLPTFNGNIWYVGGSGPGNFSTIQDGINVSNTGDTVYVFSDSSPYYENVDVHTTIDLIGENRETTIIDGGETGFVVGIFADGVNISGFTIQNSGNTPMYDAGIETNSNNTIITGNIIRNNGDYAVGIFLNQSSHNHIINNVIYKNGNEGIFLEGSTYNLIQYNEIFHNGHCSVVISQSSYNNVFDNNMYENHDAAVSLWPNATNNEIAYNTIYGNPYSGIGLWETANNNYVHNNHLYDNPLYGVKLKDAHGNVIERNTISGSSKGIILQFSSNTLIKFNNFIDNEQHAWFDNSSQNRWFRNYWDDHERLWPKRIDGEICLPWDQTKVIRWFNFDWFSSKKPHDII